MWIDLDDINVYKLLDLEEIEKTFSAYQRQQVHQTIIYNYTWIIRIYTCLVLYIPVTYVACPECHVYTTKAHLSLNVSLVLTICIPSLFDIWTDIYTLT